MITVNMHEAKTTLSKLIKKVEEGEVVRIARNGHPVAELSHIEHKRSPLVPDPRLKGEILGDIVSPLWPDGWDVGPLPDPKK